MHRRLGRDWHGAALDYRPFKARIAEAAIAALSKGDALADIGQIGQRVHYLQQKFVCRPARQNFVIAICADDCPCRECRCRP